MSLANFVPKSLRLPLRYYYHRVTGRLEPEIEILPELVRRSGRAIDVGAFNGEYAYALAKLSHIVECFEPQPVLAESIRSYRSKKIVVHNMGLADVDGELTLHIPVDGEILFRALASFREIVGKCDEMIIPVHRLDRFEFQDVTIIKIDVEGYEAMVLEGAKQTILREKPVLLVEIEQRHLNEIGLTIDDVFRQALEFGYKGFFLKDGQRVDLARFDYKTDQEPFLHNPLDSKYINNFIFQPPEI